MDINWQKELANCFTTLESLLTYLQIDAQGIDEHTKARALFPMKVPRPFAKLMQKGNWHDPLLQQVFPLADEFTQHPDFIADPLQEQNNQTKGILHKYLNRVLLIVRGGCAVNCRYCFRRHFPYQDNAMNKAQWREALAHIRQDDNIDEVILSGGDPLMAKDEHLAWLAQQVADIGHIKRLRIHTRLPVVIPSRLNDEFSEWFTKLPVQKVMVLHMNHANEMSEDLAQRCLKLREQGVTLLNQSVLLRGINDKTQSLIDLHERLFSAGILPYYLHLLDKVKGAAHFDVPQAEAIRLMHEIIKRQPGYLVPKLVREIGGQPGKTPIDLHLQP